MRKILLAITVLFILADNVYSQTNEFKIGFTGAYPLNWDQHAYEYTYNNMDWGWYSELSMNLWSGWQIDGRHTDVIYNLEQNELNGYFQPDTMIYRASYGRISLFQAESDYTGRHRYTDHHSMGICTTDVWMGETQRVQYYHATTPYNPAEAILTVIDENCEQVYSAIPTQKVKNSDDPNLLWYIKPRMRIDRDVALNEPNKRVAEIIVRAYDHSVILDQILYAYHFRYTDPNTYDGRYLEEYWYSSIYVTGDQITSGLQGYNLQNCQVDYQIFWYGEVDLWIDYVKVMDNTANDYFSADPAVRNYLLRIQKESGK